MSITRVTSDLVRHAGYLIGSWFRNKDNAVADISSPKWGAPQGAAAALQSSMSENTAAIQRMLDSGVGVIQLDNIARYVGTLVIKQPVTIRGVGRHQISLIFSGGDSPMICTRVDWSNPNSLGVNNVRIENLRAVDQSTGRPTAWTIDLSNGHSCSIYGCFIDYPTGSTPAHRYGANLGFARGSNLIGTSTVTFVCEVTRSRFVNGKLSMNTSDYYITQNELWGTGRDYALELGFGGIVHGNMFVPGTLGGSNHFSDKGYDHDTMSYLGNYFDGSTSASVFTGSGIVSSGPGLRDATINGNRFWFLNKSGIVVDKLYGCNITSNNFKDCDSDDTGDDDIVSSDVYGCTIQNTHTRSQVAPKTNQTRVNKGRAWRLTGKVGFAPSILDGVGNFAGAYLSPLITNQEMFDLRGISYPTSVSTTTLGNAINYPGRVVVIGSTVYVSNGASWRVLNPGVSNITSPTDFDNAADGVVCIPDPTIHTHLPSGVTGDCRLTTETIDSDQNFKMQVLIKLSTGKVYSRKKQAGTWQAWSA